MRRSAQSSWGDKALKDFQLMWESYFDNQHIRKMYSFVFVHYCLPFNAIFDKSAIASQSCEEWDKFNTHLFARRYVGSMSELWAQGDEGGNQNGLLKVDHKKLHGK